MKNNPLVQLSLTLKQAILFLIKFKNSSLHLVCCAWAKMWIVSLFVKVKAIFEPPQCLSFCPSFCFLENNLLPILCSWTMMHFGQIGANFDTGINLSKTIKMCLGLVPAIKIILGKRHGWQFFQKILIVPVTHILKICRDLAENLRKIWNLGQNSVKNG